MASTYTFKSIADGKAKHRKDSGYYSTVPPDSVEWDSTSNTVAFRAPGYHYVIFVGTDTIVIDGVTYAGTGEDLQDKLIQLFARPYGGLVQSAAVTLTRPADMTAYAAKDAVSNSTSAPALNTVSNIAGTNGSGYLVKVRAFTSQPACTARLRLHIYHTNTALAAVADNAQQVVLLANFAKKVGIVDLPAFQPGGTGSDAAHALVADLRLPFKCASGSRNLFFMVETLDAFTPASGQTFHFEFTADNN